MATSPINLSAGMVPASPPPAPGGGIDLSAGMVSANPTPAAAPTAPAPAPAPSQPATWWEQAKGLAKQYIADQVDSSNPHPAGPLEAGTHLPVIGGAIAGIQRGVNKGVLGTYGGLVKIGAKMVNDFGIDGDVAAYQQQNPAATIQQARQAVAPELYGKMGDGAPSPMQVLRGSEHNDQPDFQTDSHRARVKGMMDTAQWFTDHADSHGFWEGLGSTGESIAEMMGGEGLLKLLPEASKAGEAMSLADKLKNTQRVASFLESHPKIAKLMAVGMRTAHTVGEAGAAAGTQTYVKSGGDADETAEGAAMGVAGGAAGEAIGAVGGQALRAAKAGMERLGRPSATVDAVGEAARGVLGDRIDATNATRVTAPPNPNAEPYTFEIGGTPTRDYRVGNMAQDAGKQQVGTRVVAGKGTAGPPAYDPADLQKYLRFDDQGRPTYMRPDKYEGVGLGDDGQPSYPDAAGNTRDQANPDQPDGSHKEPIFQYKPTPRDPTLEPGADRADGGGTLRTTDPKVASAHMATLERAIGGEDFDAMPAAQRSQLLASRDDIKGQIGEYYRQQQAAGGGKPNFEPINSQQAIQATGSFADAADSLHQAGVEVYDHANNVTGGQWQALDQYIGKLQDKLGEEPFAAGRADLRKQIGHAQGIMSEILENPSNGFSADDVAQAKKNFRAKYVLQDAHQAISPIYAIEQQDGAVTGQYRGMNGSQLGSRWDEFLKANPDARDIIGADRSNTLRDLFRQNETLAARKRFGSAVLSVSSALAGYHFGGLMGAAESTGAYHGVRYVLKSIVSNPKIAKNILFAIDSGARPDNYGRAIAQMIIQGAKRYAVPAAASAAARSN